MTAPAWMPLNVGDYLKDTDHLTVVEHGAYFLLILRYWQDGGLPSNERLIARYAHLTAEQWDESRDVLAALFDEGWKHKRIDTELAKAAEIISKRRSAAEQRHSKSSASAEHEESTSSYAGVPPLPLPEENNNPAPLSEPRARDFLQDLWDEFPRNPTSSFERAQAAFSATKAAEHPEMLAAAQRFSAWFRKDNEGRKRTVEAGLRFVPHLSTWIEEGSWRRAPDPKPAKVVRTVRLDRGRDEALWTECERINGKKAPADWEWAFPAEVVDKARMNLLAATASSNIGDPEGEREAG